MTRQYITHRTYVCMYGKKHHITYTHTAGYSPTMYAHARNNLAVPTHNIPAAAPRSCSYNYIFKVLFTAPSWYLFGRIRTYVSILMRHSTRSHSSPEEHYSNITRRILMCVGHIRGFHPQLLYIANSLHLLPNWQCMHIQQFNAHGIHSNSDLILVHSQ